MRRTRSTLLGVLAFLSVSSPVSGQEPDGTLVSFGLGFGSGTFEIAGVASLSIDAPVGAFVIRTGGVSEFNLFNPSESVGDLGVLYGRRWGGEGGHARLAAGPSIVWAERPGDPISCAFIFCEYDYRTNTTVGLALHGDAVWALTGSFGLQLSAFGNVNPELSYLGFAVGVRFGELRPR